MLYPDSAAVPPVPDRNAPFLSVAELAPLLGLTNPVNATLTAQITFASEAVTRMIRNYCGRMLSAGTYVEEFGRPAFWVREREAGRVGIKLNLTEWPIAEVSEILIDGTAFVSSQTTLNHSLGRLWIPWEGQRVVTPPLRVTYTGGWDPFPADLLAIYLDIVRRQLSAMGVDLTAGGSTIPGATGAVKAVTVGALRMEYAIANAPASSFASGGVSPFSQAVLDSVAPILGEYVSVRRFAATIC